MECIALNEIWSVLANDNHDVLMGHILPLLALTLLIFSFWNSVDMCWNFSVYHPFLLIIHS